MSRLKMASDAILRLAATPSPAHFIWVEVGNTANDQHEMRLGHNVGQLQSNHFLNGEQDIRDQGRELVANQWYCLEFQMTNNPDELRVWLDGQETALSTTNYTAGAGAQGNTNPLAYFIPPLEAFRIGWELQNGTVLGLQALLTVFATPKTGSLGELTYDLPRPLEPGAWRACIDSVAR